jgi:DNA-directed RNA polymerase specialized sigma24 family protein
MLSSLRTNSSTENAAETRADEAAIIAAAKLDVRAFAPLYARYYDPVYRYCYRRLGNAEAAADAAGHVFAKAIAALPRCRAETFRSWLFAIAHNTVIDAVQPADPTRRWRPPSSGPIPARRRRKQPWPPRRGGRCGRRSPTSRPTSGTLSSCGWPA